MIISYGETKDRIKEWALSQNINCESVDSLIEATKLSYENAVSGDIVLLSPACASWDKYENFEIRGNEFKSVVETFR